MAVHLGRREDRPMTSKGAPSLTDQPFDIDWFLVPGPPLGEPTVILGYD
jgi:hypothetical protein